MQTPNNDLSVQLFEQFEIDPSYLPAVSDAAERLEQCRQILIRRIEELVERDMEKLMWVLYRIDVNERKLKEALAGTTSDKFANVMADMIIARQLEKLKTRAEFSTGDSDWSFDV